MTKQLHELIKNGKRQFKRRAVHWWLTGFKLGEFSEPSELVVFITIKLKDRIMMTEFVNGLIKAGYQDEDIVIINNTVKLVFDKPKTEQPFTRNAFSDIIMQSNNKELTIKYNEMTKNLDNSIDKIIFMRDTAPDLFEEILHMMRRNMDMFNVYSRTNE